MKSRMPDGRPKGYSMTHFSMFRVSEEKFSPMRNTRVSPASKGSAYDLSYICRKASSAVPSNLNSST